MRVERVKRNDAHGKVQRAEYTTYNNSMLIWTMFFVVQFYNGHSVWSYHKYAKFELHR